MISTFLRDKTPRQITKKIRSLQKKYKMTAAYALNGHLARTRTHKTTHLQLWVGILIFLWNFKNGRNAYHYQRSSLDSTWRKNTPDRVEILHVICWLHLR